jgi:hypothetical protein
METKAALKHKRHYTVLRDYYVNLFGLPLSVSSIAFQEQDSVVGVCATSAIYALLHGVKPIFDTKLLCGLEITQLANRHAAPIPSIASSSLTRALPNTGLSLEQMFQTLSQVDLTPLMVGIDSEPWQRQNSIATLYAYLSAGLPVLAYVALVPITVLEKKKNEAGLDNNQLERLRQERLDALTAAPKHAFTITGYSLDSLENIGDKTQITQMSQLVNKVYVHCDRVGPFAKFWVDHQYDWLAFRPNAIREPTDLVSTTDHAYRQLANKEQVLAVPAGFIVPINDKLRLDFEATLVVLEAFKNHAGDDANPQAIVWDIKIASVANLKASWGQLPCMDKLVKVRMLRSDFPRFCWRIIAHIRDADTAFEAILDCTAVDVATSILTVVPHNQSANILLSYFAKNMEATLKNWSDKDGDKVPRRVLKRLSTCIQTL